jgi:hypothetical protein
MSNIASFCEENGYFQFAQSYMPWQSVVTIWTGFVLVVLIICTYCAYTQR